MSRQRAWTDDEIGFLLDRADQPARVIAEELGRGVSGVRVMRRKVLSGHVPMNAWTESEDEFILSNRDMTHEQVAKHLGRAEHATHRRRSTLAKRLGVSFRGGKSPHHVGRRTLLAKTCPKCGLLLTAKWFSRRGDQSGALRGDCIRCEVQQGGQPEIRKAAAERSKSATARRSEQNFQKLQAITREKAHHHGQPWVEADHAILDDPESTILSKALRLGRTYSAVANQCHANGYRSLVGLGDPIKGQWVIDNPNAPTPDQSAA